MGNDIIVIPYQSCQKHSGFDDFESFTDGTAKSMQLEHFIQRLVCTQWIWMANSKCCKLFRWNQGMHLRCQRSYHRNGNFLLQNLQALEEYAVLVLPCINLTNVASARLGFWYHNGMGDLYVDVQNGAGVWVNNIDYILGETHGSPIDHGNI